MALIHSCFSLAVIAFICFFDCQCPHHCNDEQKHQREAAVPSKVAGFDILHICQHQQLPAFATTQIAGTSSQINFQLINDVFTQLLLQLIILLLQSLQYLLHSYHESLLQICNISIMHLELWITKLHRRGRQRLQFLLSILHMLQCTQSKISSFPGSLLKPKLVLLVTPSFLMRLVNKTPHFLSLDCSNKTKLVQLV